MSQPSLPCVSPCEWSLDGSASAERTSTPANATCALHPTDLVPTSLCGLGGFGDVVRCHSGLYPRHVCAAKRLRHCHFTPASLDAALTAARGRFVLAESARVCESEVPASPSRSASAWSRRPDTSLDRACREAVCMMSLHTTGGARASGTAGSRHVVHYYGMHVMPAVVDTDTCASSPSSATSGSTLALLTEFLDGGSLSDCVPRAAHAAASPLASVHLVVWFSQALQGLLHLHERCQLFHRDVKPANMMMRRAHCAGEGHEPSSVDTLDGRELVLIDFGETVPAGRSDDVAGSGRTVKRAHTEEEEMEGGDLETMTALRTVLGTQGYCAPELARLWGCHGRGLYGPPADLWSLAASFYVLLVQGPAAGHLGFAALLRVSALQKSTPDSGEVPVAVHDNSVACASLANLLTACGAYPSLCTLMNEVGQGETAPAAPAPTACANEESTASSAPSWSWARAWVQRAADTESLDDATRQTFFGDTTMDQTSVLNGDGRVVEVPREAPVALADMDSSASPEEAAQRWGRHVLVVERMAKYLARHHGGRRDDTATNSASTLARLQSSLSEAFVGALDALMAVDPRQRPSARQALVRTATLRAYCGGVTVASSEVSSCWQDESFVLSLVLAHRPCVPVPRVMHTLIATSEEATTVRECACTALWLRAIDDVAGATNAPTHGLANHLRTHALHCEAAGVLLIDLEWLVEGTHEVDTESEQARLADLLTVDRVQCALAADTHHVKQTHQTLLSSAVRVAVLPAEERLTDSPCERCASAAPSATSSTCGTASVAPHATVVFHCHWYLLYVLPRTASPVAHPLCECAVLHMLSSRCEDAERALQFAVRAGDEAGGGAQTVATRRAVAESWSAQLRETSHTVRERADALQSVAEKPGRGCLFYVTTPPSAQDFLDVLLRVDGWTSGGGTTTSSAHALEVYVCRWLTEARCVTTAPWC